MSTQFTTTEEGKQIFFNLAEECKPVYLKRGYVDYDKMTEEQKRILLLSSATSSAAMCLYFWPKVMGAPLFWSPIMDTLFWSFDQLLSGNAYVRKVVYNVPPRYTKSFSVSVILPLRIWAQFPESNLLCVGPLPNLVSRDAKMTRSILRSPDYMYMIREAASKIYDVNPDFHLMKDSNNIFSYSNNSNGARVSGSLKQNLVGQNADWLIMDDLVPTSIVHKTEEQIAEELEDTKVIYDSTLRKRLANPLHSFQVYAAQKVHNDDPSGFLVREEGFDCIVLPQVFDSKHPRKSERDWREIDGELLCEERFDQAWVDKNKEKPVIYATQDQQLDIQTVVGNKFSLDCWVEYDEDPIEHLRGRYATPGDILIASYDTAKAKKAKSKYTAVVTAILRGHDIIIIDLDRIRMDTSELIDYDNNHVKKYPELFRVLVENASSGAALLDFRKGYSLYFGVNPQGTSKVGRADFTKSRTDRRKIWLPRRNRFTNYFKSEHAAFPSESEFNDFVDATSQICQHAEKELGIQIAAYEEEKYREFMRTTKATSSPSLASIRMASQLDRAIRRVKHRR